MKTQNYHSGMNHGVAIAKMVAGAMAFFAVAAEAQDDDAPLVVPMTVVPAVAVDEVRAEQPVVAGAEAPVLTVADLQAALPPEERRQVSAQDEMSEKGGGLFDKMSVEVPEEAEGKSIADAIEEIADSADKKVEYLVPEVRDELAARPYKRSMALSKGNAGDLINSLLPSHLSKWSDPDTGYLYVGGTGDIHKKSTAYDAAKLERNHTRIQFNGKNMTVFDAIERIAASSHANISTDYMEPVDQVSESEIAARQEGAVSISDIAPSATNAVSGCHRTRYSTRGEEYEWRTVLSSVVKPAGYVFDEVDGEVRVMTQEKMEAEQRKAIDRRPMSLKYVRVYHANPEEIVEKLNLLKVTANAGAKIQVAPYLEKSKGGVNSYRQNLSSSSTSLSTGNTTIGDDSSSSSGSWGNLLRPKNPPAILVYDNDDNLERIEKLIREMDVREKQVLIEALILDLSDTGSKDLGMKLDEMGFGNIPLLGVSWQKSHDKTTGHSSERSGESLRNSATERYRGKDDGASSFSTGYGFGDAGYDRNYQYGDRTVGHTMGEVMGEGRTKGNYAYSYDGDDSRVSSARFSDRVKSFSTVFGPLDFNFVLEMIEQKGDSRLLSSPVLTIGDHSEAMLHVGNVTPILNIETEVTSSTTSIVTEDVEWQELVTGILMWVGPEVTEDGNSVRLWVHPKISEATGEWESYNQTRYPHLSSQEMDTRVTVPSGSTLLMGGLTRTQQSEILKKVPILGDIPLLGRLFRHTSTSSERRNLVILIRPTILDDDAPETGFEEPAMKIIEPMMSESGRNLKDVKLGPDKMREREKAIREKLSSIMSKSLDEAYSPAEDGVAETVSDTAEAVEDAAAPVQGAVPAEPVADAADAAVADQQ